MAKQGIWLLALLAAGTAQAQERQGSIRDLGYFGISAREMMPPECPVQFDRGGVGGPREKDAAQWGALQRFLTMNPMVAHVSRYGWGREGEKTYCIVPKLQAGPCRVGEELAALAEGGTLKFKVHKKPLEQACDGKGNLVEEAVAEETQDKHKESGKKTPAGGH